MKKIIQRLAKIFKANITIEKIIEKEVIKEIYITIPTESTEPTDTTINENVFIDGDLTITGHLTVTGEVKCYSIKTNN